MQINTIFERFNVVCEQNKMIRVHISTLPTWVLPNRKEGFEFHKDKGIVKSFWVKDGERIYDEPMSTTMEKINFDDENQKEEVSKELPKTLIKFVNQLDKVMDGSRIIVPQDIEELKKMTTFDRMLLFQKTHPSVIKERQGREGRYKYVEGGIMKLEANISFLFQVSSKIDGWQIDEKGVSCYGSIKVNIDGKDVISSDIGFYLQEYKKESKEPVFTVHELMKNACTDMKKRCLANLGFNGDVYRGEV